VSESGKNLIRNPIACERETAEKRRYQAENAVFVMGRGWPRISVLRP